MSLTARQDRLAAGLAARGIDAMLVTNLVNVRYLSGYVGSNGTLLIAPQRRVLLTDFRYLTSAAGQTEGVEIVDAGQDLLAAIATVIAATVPGARVGFESAHVSHARHAQMAERMEGTALVPVVDAVEDLRIVKDAGEIAAMARACDVLEVAYAACADGLLHGRTERDVAWELNALTRAAGAERPSFDFIVASGPRGAMPHAVPADVVIPGGTLVTVDIGVVVDGYCSDCTRTFATGPLPDELARAYAVCHEAQGRALAAVRPGVRGGELDAIAREHIAANGFGDAFRHGLGHGVGLEIHEAPTARPASDDMLRPGMTVTVEPGIYLPELGGCRIEDLCVVTDDGARVLTGFTKDLLTVDCRGG